MSYLVKFYRYGIKNNVYLWFHMLAAAFLAHWLTPLHIFGVAVAWEIIEVVSSGRLKLLKTYGTLERFLFDALGDISLAVLTALLVRW